MAFVQANFPRLMPSNLSLYPKCLKGYISILGSDYYVSIDTPCFPYAKNVKIDGDIQLLEIITASSFDVQKFETSTIIEFLKIFQDNCEKFVTANPKYLQETIDDASFSCFPLLISHIEELGWDKISHVFEDFSSIDLQIKDDGQRTHKLRVKFLGSYPSERTVFEADLPSGINISRTKTQTLMEIYTAWEKLITSLQTFWYLMDDLDSTVLVVDPTSPARKHVGRRILLENHLSIHLTVSPLEPLTPPKCQILGPSHEVSKLNDRLMDLYQVWDGSESIVYNLERILKLKIIRKLSSSRSDQVGALSSLEVQCTACYEVHREEQLPDVTCDSCFKNFHLSCLFEWLQSIPTSHQNAQVIRGTCPYCTKPISCKVPS